MATYVNDLRLKEIGTGESSGTWGSETNTNLELIGEALGFGTEAITTNADTHTTTVADGSTDPGRAMYLKYTGTLDSACTITIAPNTISRMQFIENGTSGSQNIIISQGTGANVTIPAGDTKAVYLDGAGSGAAVVDAFASLSTVDLKVQDDLTVTDDASVGGDLLVSGEVQTANIGFTDGDNALTISDGGSVSFAAGVTLAGTTPTLTIGDAGAEDTKIVFDGNAQDFYIALDDSADDLLVGLGSTVGTTPIISITEAGAVTLKNVGTGDDNPMSLTLQTSETDIAANDVLGKISFQAPDEGAGTDAILVAAAIQAISEGDFSASSNATSLQFMTGSSEAATAKATLAASGDFTISGDLLVLGGQIDTGNTSGDHSEFGTDASGHTFIDASTSGGAIFFQEGGSTKVTISGGNLGIGMTPTHNFNLQATGAVEARFQSTDNDCSLQISSDTDEGQNSELNFMSGTSGRGSIVYDHNTTAASQSMTLKTGDLGVSAITILGNGLTGIGTTAPHEKLHVEGADGTEILCAVKEDTAGGLASYYFKVDSTGTDVRKKAAFIFKRDDPGTRGTGTLHICLDGANDEGSAAVVDSKMQFSADGEISITKGRTNFSAEESAFSPGSHNGHMIDINGQSASGRAATNTQTHRSFLNPNGTVGTISTNGSATAYNTSSDYRLKENVVTNWDGTTLLKQLKPSKFNFKTDASTTVHGFLAHEVSSIVPEAVTGEKDAVYTAEEAVKGLAVEGQPKYQGIDQAKLVPLLVKTIQEMDARITTLEG